MSADNSSPTWQRQNEIQAESIRLELEIKEEKRLTEQARRIAVNLEQEVATLREMIGLVQDLHHPVEYTGEFEVASLVCAACTPESDLIDLPVSWPCETELALQGLKRISVIVSND